MISASARRRYRAQRREDPHVAAVDAWEKRTRNAALSMLARKFPAEYLALLDEVREADPRPVAEARVA